MSNELRNPAELIEEIKRCDSSEESIRNIGKSCLHRGAKAKLELAKFLETLIMNQSESYTLQLKMNLLRIMSFILLNDDRSKDYYRHLCPRIYNFILNNRDKIDRDENATRSFIAIFQAWHKQKIFGQTFYNKLVSTSGQILSERIYEHFQAIFFVKYPKEILRYIRDVNMVETAAEQYRIVKETYLLSQKVKDLKRQHTVPYKESEERHKLRDSTDQLIQQHSDLLSKLQHQISLMAQLFKGEAVSLGFTSSRELFNDV